MARWLASRRERPVHFGLAKRLLRNHCSACTLELSTGAGRLQADAYVAALGPQTAAFWLFARRGVPMYPVKGSR